MTQLTPLIAVNIMEKYAKKERTDTIAGAIEPIVEFFYIADGASKQGPNWKLFSKAGDHPYRAGLQDRLNNTYGIYVFHDSRGRAIYVGKAHKQTLWKEMNLAFNRRREVQSIKRVDHPSSRVAFKEAKHGRRSITKRSVILHDIASYISAYQIEKDLIGKLGIENDGDGQ